MMGFPINNPPHPIAFVRKNEGLIVSFENTMKFSIPSIFFWTGVTSVAAQEIISLHGSGTTNPSKVTSELDGWLSRVFFSGRLVDNFLTFDA